MMTRKIITSKNKVCHEYKSYFSNANLIVKKFMVVAEKFFAPFMKSSHHLIKDLSTTNIFFVFWHLLKTISCRGYCVLIF